MRFEYTSDTTVDDIIEHILMRLNTDFKGSCLQVPDFCHTSNYDYDTHMELKVRSKMYEHGVAKRCQGVGQPETAINIMAKGIDVFDNGGWQKYLADYEAQDMVRRERENQPPIYVSGNAIIGNNNLGITQGRDFRASSITNTALYQTMTISEHIDQILHDAEEGYVAHPTRGSSNEYEKAFDKLVRHGLVKPISKDSYELTLEGEKAIEFGGFENWKKHKEEKESHRHNNIHVSGGNTIIGSHNSGVIQAQEGALINTGNEVRIEVKKEDFESLAKKLRENQVSQQDIDELKTILKSDGLNKEKGTFGAETNGWITKMIAKSLDGTWQIGIGAAGGLLVEAIRTFYGW
ncbi:hypothetical protein [Spirosoma agri]|uniref:Uncharacterized protein n=1 Tax=Spirosoma agri TaxID=1987381 RepID=A0A6M0ICH7_9BACT|nr:hypothetical protein [Spirosoma agri]NEU65956.1 hypothetical protein [Spirosoma agri]